MAPVGTSAPAASSAPSVQVEDEPAPKHDSPLVPSQWRGTGVQSDGQNWPIVVKLWSLDAGVCGVIDYPTVPCSGQWVCLGSADGTGWRNAREDIKRGNCIDGGTFRFRIDGEQMTWTWTMPPEQRHVPLSARGTLRKFPMNEPNDDIWGDGE